MIHARLTAYQGYTILVPEEHTICSDHGSLPTTYVLLEMFLFNLWAPFPTPR